MSGNEETRKQNGTDTEHEDLVVEADQSAVLDENSVNSGKAGTAEEETDRYDSMQQALELAEKKARENMELAQLTKADMENLRKRTVRDIENAHKYALERFVNELLPVMDSLELGIQASDSSSEAEGLKEGMQLTLKKFTDTLEKFGVAVVDPIGEKFNPDQHDAVSMAETEEHASGTVISVLQKGYELNGRLVRPAMVVVAS